MSRLIIVLIVVGGILLYFGYEEYNVGANATVDPARVDLARLEQGKELESTHVEFGDHLKLYGGVIMWGDFEKGREVPRDTANVDYCYYPIISSEHPYASRLKQLREQYGSLGDIPDEQWPRIDRFKVLVKSTEYRTAGVIKVLAGKYIEEESQIAGLVVNSITSLKSQEKARIREKFPNVDLERVIILQKNRKPTSTSVSIGMMAGGVALIAFPIIGLVLLHRRDKAKEEAALASAEGNFAGGFSPDAVTGPSTATESAVGEVPPPPPATGGEAEKKSSPDEDDDKNPYRV
jgi:hypothetical protein